MEPVTIIGHWDGGLTQPLCSCGAPSCQGGGPPKALKAELLGVAAQLRAGASALRR